MYKISYLMALLQTLLIVLAIFVWYNFHHLTKENVEWWINTGENIMKYQIIPVLFFVVTFFVSIFYKEKWWLKLIIGILSIIGFLIWSKLWLYPW